MFLPYVHLVFIIRFIVLNTWNVLVMSNGLKITLLVLSLLSQTAFALTGSFFDVIASGNPGKVDFSLCLNGVGPITCQKQNVSALDLIITTTVPNHSYPLAGIKINTPGYGVNDLSSTCRLISNGYCIFSVSHTSPKTISIVNLYTISGSVSGLTASGLVLQNNGSNDLKVSQGATSFQFPTNSASGSTYNVTIKQQPNGLRCVVYNGSGTNLTTASVTNVAVDCHVSNVYVVNNLTNGFVTPIIMASNTPESAIPLANNTYPVMIAVTPNGQTAYVTNNSDQANSVSIIDLTQTPPRLNGIIGVWLKPYGIAITPDGTMAYVVNFNGTVTQIDLATSATITTINLVTQQGSTTNLFNVAITPDGKTAYVTDNGGGKVYPITLATNQVGSGITVGANPWGIAITPDGKTAYVANSGDGTVTPINIANNSPGAAISVGSNTDAPLLIAITPDGKKAYVTLNNSYTVVPIDIASDPAIPGSPIVVGDLSLPLTLRPYGIAITPDGKTAYVAIYGGAGSDGQGKTVVPITIETNTVGQAITLTEEGPAGIAIS